MGEHRRQRVGRAERPEERHGQPETIGRGEALTLADVEAVVEHAAVRERHALRGRRGAGRIEDEGHVGRARPSSARSPPPSWTRGPPAAESSAQRRTPSWRRSSMRDDRAQLGQAHAAQGARRRGGQLRAHVVEGAEVRPAAERLHGDDDAGPRMLERPRDLARRRERADGDGDGADLRRGERGDRATPAGWAAGARPGHPRRRRARAARGPRRRPARAARRRSGGRREKTTASAPGWLRARSSSRTPSVRLRGSAMLSAR